jgi:predicted RecA/RadA family phage recombinase
VNNFVREEDELLLTAPSGGVTSGLMYQIGNILVVAKVTAAAGVKFPGRVTGVVTLPCAASQAWTEGQILYWDNTAFNISTSSASGANKVAGCAASAKSSSATAGEVRLNGIAA